MSFTFDSTNQRYEAPGLTVSRVSLTLTNNPLWCSYSDGKPSHWDALFKYEFSCLANGGWIRFEFEQPDPILYNQYSIPGSVETFLIPHLEKVQGFCCNIHETLPRREVKP